MCLVAIAWRAHPHYPLVLAGNRDEFYARATAPAGWWSDSAQVFGGRDLVGGGSWLAVSRTGRFAVVLNNPARPPDPEQKASRGQLVRGFVTGQQASGRFLDAVRAGEQAYAGFFLLVGTLAQVRVLVSPASAGAARWTLPAGISVFSNSPPEQPWPKATYVEQALRAQLRAPAPDREALFGLLAQRHAVADPGGANHDIARTPFIAGERYGTRASTLVTVDAEGLCEFEERSFGPAGRATGTVRERFELAG